MQFGIFLFEIMWYYYFDVKDDTNDLEMLLAKNNSLFNLKERANSLMDPAEKALCKAALDDDCRLVQLLKLACGPVKSNTAKLCIYSRLIKYMWIKQEDQDLQKYILSRHPDTHRETSDHNSLMDADEKERCESILNAQSVSDLESIAPSLKSCTG